MLNLVAAKNVAKVVMRIFNVKNPKLLNNTGKFAWLVFYKRLDLEKSIKPSNVTLTFHSCC